MEFIIATNNKKKLREMGAILGKLGVRALSLAEAGIESDAKETGTTFEENSRIKALAAMRVAKLPAIADDSGLEVDALGGEPGVYSARYGGDKCRDDVERYEYLLENMKNVPDGERQARFVSVITCVFPDGREISARGEIEGEILREPHGEGGFGYDPIFFVPDEGMTTAEMTQERKNEISHRAKSLRIMAEKLEEVL
ncbi:MAG: RdgB/HAM1 family non-canonical purine NTP pyrophosphatase [Oscillospiraceae bacterium]|nr:RdgB/HAM1 family non-canonical purine NTP pyrophosphatase [Oscillospiraceae bacterium]MBQ4316078.1 RdgB/HAM1 family non-canonical purine NTP pyrophosphatase [Oscillospiraceae bacterium]